MVKAVTLGLLPNAHSLPTGPFADTNFHLLCLRSDSGFECTDFRISQSILLPFESPLWEQMSFHDSFWHEEV